MNSRTLPLADLAQKLADKQSELDKLRHTFDARLSTLKRRKEGLEADLRRVESEIQAATQESGSLAAVTVSELKPAVSGATSLPQFLLGIIREKGGPVTVAELTSEIVQRKFPTSSQNLPKMVGNRVHDLLKKGLLARPKGKKGVILGHGQADVRKEKSSPKPAAPAQASSNGSSAAPAAPATPSAPAAPTAGKKKVSLRALLADLLGKSTHPLKAQELADLALASGYKTKSKNFIDVIWTALGQMGSVINDPGVGYRLK